MKEMSEAPGLSKNYTNHPVRATTITLWSNASLSNRHIMAISGHRNEQSLRSYNARPSSAQLQHSSDVLSNALGATSAPSTSVQIHPQAPQAQIYITPECPVVLQKCHLQQHVLGLLDWQHASGRQTTREVDETRSIYNAWLPVLALVYASAKSFLVILWTSRPSVFVFLSQNSDLWRCAMHVEQLIYFGRSTHLLLIGWSG